MSLSEEFLAFVLDQFSDWGGVTARKMFGGAGLYRNGTIFGLIAGDVVFFKTDESTRPPFVAAGCAPFKPYPNERAGKTYYEVPAEVLEDRDLLVAWAGRALDVSKGHP